MTQVEQYKAYRAADFRVWVQRKHDVLPPVVVSVHGGAFSFQDYLTADQARDLAVQLRDAADEVDDRA